MKVPTTQALRSLKAAKIDFEPHLYKYEEKGGTAVSARELGVDEFIVVKTIVLEDEKGRPLIVLMNGTNSISTKNLARIIGVKTIQPCDPATAQKHTGYMVGGTSPFGTKKVLPVYVQEDILELEKIYINGGKRGFLVSLNPKVLKDVLKAEAVDVKA